MFGARKVHGYGAAGDAYWDDVKLLLMMDGTNGSTTFTDSSDNAKTVTAQNTAQLTTTDPKYGTACGDFTTSWDHVSIVSTDNDFQTGDVDFCVDMWAKPDSGPTGIDRTVFERCANGAGINLCVGLGGIRFRGNSTIDLDYVTTLVAGTWVHVAFQYVAATDTKEIYLNGTRVANAVTNINTSGVCAVEIGSPTFLSSTFRFTGHLDAVRYTNAHRFPSSGFTPAEPIIG